MQDTKKRTIISLILSLFYYLILAFYNFVVYMDYNNNKDIILMAILCTLVVIPLFLFSTFFIKNEYKIITGKVTDFIGYHFWIHIIVYFITIYISTINKTLSKSSFIVSITIIGVAILLTKYFSDEIYKETNNLPYENENKILELTFQNATIFGLLAFILCFFIFTGIVIGGKNIIALVIIAPFFISVLILNYIKVKLIDKYKIVNPKRVLFFDNIILIINILIAFYFSHSNLLVLNVVQKYFHMSFLSSIFFGLMLLPMIITNKKIGNEWTRLKTMNLDV
ncbi:hypothetical protein LGL55_23060 [Clostridium tagluense]|uniref:hypothetical protein n=1 Tax=Clostridium tagluense TaxID=360422 RepID=UPI001CF41D08|nr:hypothetical protein [Clostridium tagluense]MCB2313667.1 hypothetical protein [Clostridium tagluense]MCB2318777.1 hypothetical protein [Clostridium tagluense]MCB2323627.1 hypothetical protein [Clostridium tagluense]MCB2328522.1 hypothetical protein [Clostridium tagluense]MCB2333021.1 hypothetical protein [Clostridium tagluense]